VFRRIASLYTSDAVIGMRWRQVVFVRGQSVVMLGMIVISVVVRVQQRPYARGRNERRNEQQRQDALHNDESMGQAGPRSKLPHETAEHQLSLLFAVNEWASAGNTKERKTSSTSRGERVLRLSTHQLRTRMNVVTM
jgi:hypothetical protein